MGSFLSWGQEDGLDDLCPLNVKAVSPASPTFLLTSGADSGLSALLLGHRKERRTQQRVPQLSLGGGDLHSLVPCPDLPL